MISLSKGGNISLSKESPNSTKFLVGAGWDRKRGDGGHDFDVDIMAISVGSDGKARGDQDFFYYGNGPRDANGHLLKGQPFTNAAKYLFHKGDNRDGEGDGDDEQLILDTSAVPADITKIIVLLTIFDAETRRQQFGSIENAYVRVVDAETPEDESKTIRYDMTEDFGMATVVTVVEFYRHNSEWKLRAKGEGYSNGIADALRSYGFNVG